MRLKGRIKFDLRNPLWLELLLLKLAHYPDMGPLPHNRGLDPLSHLGALISPGTLSTLITLAEEAYAAWTRTPCHLQEELTAI